MKVKSDGKPILIDVESRYVVPNKVEVRLRENIKPYEEKIEGTDTVIKGYEYDEYLFILDKEEGLEDKIKNNLDDWLATGRTLEVNTNASLYVRAKTDAIDEYTEELIKGGVL